MRSSPFEADPLDPGPWGFAHRGLHSGWAVPENSLAACRAAIELGAGIEFDLRLTADDRLVVFHDADARRLCASPLKIGRCRLEDLAALRVGDHPIPTLGSMLELVAGQVPLLLEAKVEHDGRRWPSALKRELAGYRGPFGVMSFHPLLCRLIRQHMPDVRRGLLVRHRLGSFERDLHMRIAAPDYLAVETAALGRSWVAAARQSMPVYAWTVRTVEERAQASVHADALIWEGDGRPRN